MPRALDNAYWKVTYVNDDWIARLIKTKTHNAVALRVADYLRNPPVIALPNDPFRVFLERKTRFESLEDFEERLRVANERLVESIHRQIPLPKPHSLITADWDRRESLVIEHRRWPRGVLALRVVS